MIGCVTARLVENSLLKFSDLRVPSAPESLLLFTLRKLYEFYLLIFEEHGLIFLTIAILI